MMLSLKSDANNSLKMLLYLSNGKVNCKEKEGNEEIKEKALLLQNILKCFKIV